MVGFVLLYIVYFYDRVLYRKGPHVTDVGMIMMETGMLAHNYNFEGTYKDLDSLKVVFVFEVCFPENIHNYLVNNNLTFKQILLQYRLFFILNTVFFYLVIWINN